MDGIHLFVAEGEGRAGCDTEREAAPPCKWAEQQPRLLLKEIKAIPPAEGGRNAAYFLLDGFLETGGAFKYVLHKARRS